MHQLLSAVHRHWAVSAWVLSAEKDLTCSPVLQWQMAFLQQCFM